jgi:DNA-binding transcriptional MocR family regulator
MAGPWHGLARARAAGELLAASGTADAVDALTAMVALPGDQLLTSGPGDFRALVAHRAIAVTVVRV